MGKVKREQEVIVISPGVGYVCPGCEEVIEGLPEILEVDGEIVFHCVLCGKSWENTQNLLQMAVIK